MCPVNSKASCSDPKALSCSFRGCGPLPTVPALKATSLAFLGTPERSLSGASTSLVCRSQTERKLTVTLGSALNPDNIIVLDQEQVDASVKEPPIPDWCPTENCVATGNAAFMQESNADLMTNCYTGGYLGTNFNPRMLAAQPRCAKATSITYNDTRGGYVWEPSTEYETCAQSNGEPCPHQVPKSCPVADCLQASLPWTDPEVPGLIHTGCSYAQKAKVFSEKELRCPKKTEVTIVDGEIHFDTFFRASKMEACDTVDKITDPCPQLVPTLMKKKKAAKKNAEKSHQFQIEACQDGFEFLAMDNQSTTALTLYLAFDGSFLKDSYELLRLYELEALPDKSKACLQVNKFQHLHNILTNLQHFNIFHKIAIFSQRCNISRWSADSVDQTPYLSHLPISLNSFSRNVMENSISGASLISASQNLANAGTWMSLRLTKMRQRQSSL